MYAEPAVFGREGLLFGEREFEYEKYWKSSCDFKVVEAVSGVSVGDCEKRGDGCRVAWSVVVSRRTKGSWRTDGPGDIGASPLRHRASRYVIRQRSMMARLRSTDSGRIAAWLLAIGEGLLMQYFKTHVVAQAVGSDTSKAWGPESP